MIDLYSPCEALLPYVRHYGILRSDRPWKLLTFPLGHTQLVFHLRTPLYIPELATRHHPFTVSGQVDFPAHILTEGDTETIVVALRPHALRAFVDLPVSLLRNREIPGHDLEEPALDELAAQVLDCEDPMLALQRIEEWLLSRLAAISDRRAMQLQRMAAAIDRLYAAPRSSVGQLAHAACLCPKQFERTFAATVGMNPQEYARIVRFRKALWLMRSRTEGLNWARIACASGYADQSHLIRECRRLGGHTPATLLAAYDSAVAFADPA